MSLNELIKSQPKPWLPIRVWNCVVDNAFQLIAGASSGFVLTSDAAGNGTWSNPTSIGVTALSSDATVSLNGTASASGVKGAVTVAATGAFGPTTLSPSTGTLNVAGNTFNGSTGTLSVGGTTINGSTGSYVGAAGSSLTTSNFTAGASGAATLLLGNAAGPSTTTLTGTLKMGSVTAGLATWQYTSVALSAATVNGMFAAPAQIVAAPGAGNTIWVRRVVISYQGGSAAFVNGGTVVLQYGNTVNGGGNACSDITTAEIPATFLTSGTTSQNWMGNALPHGLATTATTDNLGIFLSNKTAAFTTGTGGSVNVKLWYAIEPTTTS